MSPGVFAQALDMCEEYGSAPFIGGGEPTLHPNFDSILLDAIVTTKKIDSGLDAGIITNGSIKSRALKIAALAQTGVIWGRLSRDQYHDPISDEVIHAFEGLMADGVHDTSNGGTREPLPHGRGKELLGWDDDQETYEDYRGEGECPCDDWIVKPGGDIYQCGCDDAPKIGTVWDGMDIVVTGCHKSDEFTDECLRNNCDDLLYA